MDNVNDLLDAVSQVLWRCFLFGVLFLFIWAGMYFAGRDLMFRQAEWFGMTPHECALVAYGGMGFMKILNLMFFLFPLVAIRLVLRKRRK